MKGLGFLRALAVGASLTIGGVLAPSKLAMPPRAAIELRRGKGKGSAPALRMYRAAQRVSKRIVDSGFWRLTDTVSRNRKGTPEQQTARIAAAEDKRARRALVADRNAWRCYVGNPCLDCSNRHNPTFVNRSE